MAFDQNLNTTLQRGADDSQRSVTFNMQSVVKSIDKQSYNCTGRIDDTQQRCQR